MGNPLGKQRRKRRRMSQRRKQLTTCRVPSETIEKIIHLHDIEHKGFRKVADMLGMTKDRAHRIYARYAVIFEKRRKRMFNQDTECQTLRKAEQEIEIRLRHRKMRNNAL
jgi:NADH:ubiquinone oxidoreductase subunit E